MSKRIDNSWNYWTKPQNLGEPFNSKSWDAYFSIGDNGTVGYTSTNRKHSVPSNVGGADLVYDTLPFYLVPEKSLKKLNNDLANNKNDGDESGDNSTETSVVDTALTTIIIHDTLYITQVIPCNPLDTMSIEQLNLELNKSKILFDFGSSVLRSDAYYKLDVIVSLMKKKPDMKIELGGHTDAIGYSKRNQAQSEERAESAKRYLAARGVPINRIVTKGYSNKKPVASNETDAGRQLNRRVDIIVISE
jgi:outer membrane protein OmpA-like peptidoglycan-associated protein